MVSVNCPSCKRAYNAPVTGVIDANRTPQLKSLLLQGRLNVSTCPHCGLSGMMSVPLVYHDAEKEFLFCLIPQELQVNESERQRIIGEMSRAIMNTLPPEQRKGYLLNPRIFLTVQTMVEAVLEGDGITKDMLQAQEEKLQLMHRMAQATGDSLALTNMMIENQAQIDQEFLVLLSTSIQAAQQQGETESVERFNALWAKLLEQTPAGQEIAAWQKELERILQGVNENITQEQLLNKVISIKKESEDDILGILISIARSLIDYRFFQLMTERIEQAEQAGDTAFVDKVTRRRAKILNLIQQLDAQVRETMANRAALLQEMLQSRDPKSVIRAHLGELDNAFMSVLGLNIEQAAQQGETEAQNRLKQIGTFVTDVLTENAPPEIRFVQQLLQADYPEQTRQMLQANPARVTAQFIQTLKLLAQDFGDRQQAEIGEKLEQIAAQAQLVAGAAP